MNDLIVTSYQEHALGRPSICFGTTVNHAYNLSNLFKERGITSECIHGGTPFHEREAILGKYKAGEIDVLSNCAVLTEGFDAPSTACVIVARPTKSKGLYQQMAGRGLRIFPGEKRLPYLGFWR